MPKTPNLAIFCCETCGKQLTTDQRMGDHLIPWKRRLPITADGSCAACDGDSWTISVVYAEESTDVGPTLIGMGLAAATGVGFTQSSTSINQSNYPNIPAAVVAKLNENPRSRMRRISEFATTMERQELVQGGAKECTTCGMLFTPVPSKPWSIEGYCSKACILRNKGAIPAATNRGPGTVEPTRRPTIQVWCEEGHVFDVPVSFRGMLRPCPQCGIKTRVPGDIGMDTRARAKENLQVLRRMTQAGISDCRRALTESNDDICIAIRSLMSDEEIKISIADRRIREMDGLRPSAGTFADREGELLRQLEAALRSEGRM